MPLEINLGVEGLDRAVTSLERVARTYDRLDRGGAGALSRTRLADPERQAREAARIAREAERAQRAQERAQERAQRAQERAQREAERAQRAQERAERQAYQRSFAGRAERLARSTRFDVGGFSPLAGQAFDLIEGLGGKITGPLIAATLGIAAAGKAAEAMAREVAAATVRINEFSQAQALTGGTAGQLGALRAFGLSGAGAAAAANQLRERLSSDPMAMLAAGRMLPPAWMGTQNNARFLVQELTRLRGVRDPEEQLRQSRMLGLDQFVDTLRISEPVWQRLMRAAQRNAEVMDQNTQQARDLRAASEALSLEWETARTKLAAQFIPAVTNFMERMNSASQTVSDFFSSETFREGQGGITQTIIDLFDLLTGETERRLMRGREDDARRAQDEHTRAMKDHTLLLRDIITGGAERARAAIPPGLTGEALRRAIEDRTFRGGSAFL